MLKNIDIKDLAILRELDQDVRASSAQIGRKVRLSKEVVQYRIKKLEQEKIIIILSNADRIIELERIYLSKLIRLKQGLMQDLLTGKVRVQI